MNEQAIVEENLRLENLIEKRKVENLKNIELQTINLDELISLKIAAKK